MKVRDFLADDRFLTRENREGRKHSDPKIREIMEGMAMRRAIMCADGFTMSVQYSAFHYCNAREPFLGGEWKGRGHPLPEIRSVEIGFPSKREKALKRYAEEWRVPLFGEPYRHDYGTQRWREWARKRLPWLTRDNSTRTVYAWVPIDVAEYVVQQHGGITHVRSDSFATWEPV